MRTHGHGEDGHQTSGRRGQTYLRFGAMIVTATIVMYVLTYSNVFAMEHIRFSEERLYMVVLMASAMTIIMLGYMRGMYKDTAVIWMGEFSRTPRINGNAGRDHWARSWSVVVGGGAFKNGQVVGQTNADGTEVDSEPYTSQDLMASVCKAVGISLETTFMSRSGRN